MLILCSQAAARPLGHPQLNIRIYNEQELAYLISTYPLLCMGSFISDELAEWLGEGIRREDLSELVVGMRKKQARDEDILMALVDGCNYLNAAERELFASRLGAIRELRDYERLREEGRVLFRIGSYSASAERFREAVRALETDFRRRGRGDDMLLRRLHEMKAELLLDEASALLQLFDERGALRLIRESTEVFHLARADQMLYLYDGSGELSSKDKKKLDKRKEEAYQKALESPAYRQVQEIFESGDLRQAMRLAASWKKSLRRM